MKTKIRLKRLQATMIFNKKVAIRQMDTSYYVAQHVDGLSYTYIENEKIRLSTRKWNYITDLIQRYKSRSLDISTTGKILKGIYEKNKLIAKKQTKFLKTTNVLQIVARMETLLLAYNRVKKNRGAMDKAANVDVQTLRNYSELEKQIYYRKKIFPDGFSLRDLEITSILILKGKYPWGSSRRIWLEKPGDPLKKRPITIPPFLDRVIQEAIKMVLHAIWEPDFEVMNRSFGFRPNKSSHDAICALKSNYTNGLFRAIEGDIQAAYDNVNKEILLTQLGQKIEDKKFLMFMKKRLNYDYVDNNRRLKPVQGIPQGGIDSPYLFNIYLLDFDKFVHTKLVSYLDTLNDRSDLPPGRPGKPLPCRHAFYNRIVRKKARLKSIKKELKEADSTSIKPLKLKLYNSIKEIRLDNHRLREIPYTDPTRVALRLFYVRYADDWIILSNVNTQIAAKLKSMITAFLANKLNATLSETKTLITDIRKKPAHFLGFQIRRAERGRRVHINGRLQYAPGLPILTFPDTQRIINKLHTRGFCDKRGFPTSISWLSTLETHIIIQRFNASMLGFMQYYTEWVHWKSTLSRWIYIMRYSCFKTIAQKYSITISKVFRKFGVNLSQKYTKTIAATATLTVNDVVYEKSWTLYTFEELRMRCLSQRRLPLLSRIFLEREQQGLIGDYELKNSTPTVTHENYLEAITWVSLRTQATFDLP
jgi:retron-type reverse transcriptase